MQDKQNKGIGGYKDRPGYFWGGVVGGAILGALVNKMQGKDVKRGAMWGGITGGMGSAFMGPSSNTWLSKMPEGLTKSMFTAGAGAFAKNPALAGGILGAGGAWLAGDPKYDEEKWERKKREEEAKRREANKRMYKYYYRNPWTGDEMYNSGGAVNARKGFQYGGGAWSGVESDEEIQGSGQDKIMSITGQSGLEGQQGLEDILESLEMSSGPGQGDMSGWYEMYEDLKGKGELPDWMDSFDMFMQNLDVLDISPGDFAQAGPQTQGRFPFVGGEMAAEGGYKTRPKYQDAGAVTKSQRGQMWLDEEKEEREKRMMELVMMNAKLKQPTGRMLPDTITRSQQEAETMGLGAGSEETVDRRYDFLENRAIDTAKEMTRSQQAEGALTRSQRGELEEYFARFNPMAFRAEGGIADLDMTGGGASYGPGTGTSDDIPAMLSDGEFVVTANAVKNLGGGDRMVGAKKMYQMMNQLDPDSQTPAEMSTVGIT